MKQSFMEKLRSIFALRNITSSQDIELFLNGNKGLFHSPFIFSDMEKAVCRINKAIENNESILVMGDSDSDGITATAITYDYLKSQGANVSFFIPKNGENSKALNREELVKWRENGVKLIITVDMGVSYKKTGDDIPDIIITDHHECSEQYFDAQAVIDPKCPNEKYPFLGLSGAGVALKLICALNGNSEHIIERYCDLVAIGTIADAMPLIDENRNLVKLGLQKINKKMRPAINALLKTAGFNFERPVTASVVGFVIAPRINAAGRIDRSEEAVELLLCNDKLMITELANEFAAANRQRQQIELEAMSQATELIDKEVDLDKDKIIVLGVDDWQQGIAGIVASRLADRYSLPCMVVSFVDGIGKGSARSLKGFSLFPILNKNKELLLEFGGHELAAGIELKKENYEEFKQRIKLDTNEFFLKNDIDLSVKVDAEIDTEDINIEFAETLSMLEPFGCENPQPVFLCKEFIVEDIMSLANDRHLKLTLEKNGNKYNALYFGRTLREIKCTRGDVVDVYFAMDINKHKNRNSLQLIIKRMDISPVSLCYGYEEEYKNFIENGVIPPLNAQPDKNDIISVYRYLLRLNAVDWEKQLLNPITVARYISRDFERDMNYSKLMIAICILEQLKMVEYKIKGKYLCAVAFSVNNKINMSQSTIWKQLKG